MIRKNHWLKLFGNHLKLAVDIITTWRQHKTDFTSIRQCRWPWHPVGLATGSEASKLWSWTFRCGWLGLLLFLSLRQNPCLHHLKDGKGHVINADVEAHDFTPRVISNPRDCPAAKVTGTARMFTA